MKTYLENVRQEHERPPLDPFFPIKPVIATQLLEIMVFGPWPDRDLESMLDHIHESSSDHSIFGFVNDPQRFSESVTSL